MVLPSSDHVDSNLFSRREAVMLRWILGMGAIVLIASAVWIKAMLETPTLWIIVSVPILGSVCGVATRILLSWTLASLPVHARGQSRARFIAMAVASVAVVVASLAAFVAVDGVLAFRVSVAILISVTGQISLSVAFKFMDYMAVAVGRGSAGLTRRPV